MFVQLISNKISDELFDYVYYIVQLYSWIIDYKIGLKFPFYCNQFKYTRFKNNFQYTKHCLNLKIS